ncbi:hypothetical protein PMG11_11377 [Penicillium brasilianum]|uniref:Uncharacterized protein n=1 Tax=Penicillium brasilianum TaxID=104259 RepID=A0A0F7U5Y1_PENBI|nr:hypothetical protein PMG11_11377 [Penicillium brasilianum]
MDQDTNAAIDPRNETVVMVGTNLHFTDVDDHSWSKVIHRNVNARQRFRQSGRTSDEIIAETDQSGQSEEKQSLSQYVVHPALNAVPSPVSPAALSKE